MNGSTHKQVLIGAGVLIVVFIAAFLFLNKNSEPPQEVLDVSGGADADERTERMLIHAAVYSCDEGKSITAAYYEMRDAPQPQPGEPPMPTGSVEVSFDGGATSTLAQTISASGARYANSDESLIFWNKGNEALILRGNSMDLEYTNCTSE